MENLSVEEYRQLCTRTLPLLPKMQLLEMTRMGRCGEVGELLELVKKTRFHAHTYVPEKWASEVGDVLWYCVGLVTVLGRTAHDLSFDVSAPAQGFQWVALVRSASDSSSASNHVIFQQLCALLKEHAPGVTLRDAAVKNVEKLKKRYPNGFSSEASVRRVDTDV